MAVADAVAAKMNAMISEFEGEGAADEGESVTPEVTETAVEDGATEQADAAPAEPETAEQAETKARAARVALFEEKLAHAREKRQSQRLAEQAKADRKAAKEEREAAAAGRAKFDGINTVGKIRETLTHMGVNPREHWEAMNKEAIEASTPEAQAKRDEAAREKALAERFAPMEQELAQLKAERAQYAAQAHENNVVNGFQRAVADPAFADLRIEYPDEILLDHARHYDKHPAELRQHARDYGVQLTAPEKGFTMHELLQVLSAAQAAHNDGVQKRRAAQRPAEPQSAPPTVNGTAPRRPAASAVGNDLASTRASAKPDTSLSVKEAVRRRMDEEIRRSEGR